MKTKLLFKPTPADWLFVKKCALFTIGKDVVSTKVPIEWKHKILEARHSPIRELKYVFELEIPYWVSVHLCRHVHAQPYVQSQRNDRQDNYDRNTAPQGAIVKMIWTMNAEELMTIANKRLCGKASQETRQVVQEMCNSVLKSCPEFDGLLVPMCEYHGGVCHEMFPCNK